LTILAAWTLSCGAEDATEPTTAGDLQALTSPDGKADKVGDRSVLFDLTGEPSITGFGYVGIAVVKDIDGETMKVESERIVLHPRPDETVEITVTPMGVVASHTDDLQYTLYVRGEGEAWWSLQLRYPDGEAVSRYEQVSLDLPDKRLSFYTRNGDGDRLQGDVSLEGLLGDHTEVAVAVSPYATWFSLVGAYDYTLDADCSGRACTAPNTEGLLETYVLSRADQFPEGGVYDSQSRSFFVGSLTDASITRVSADGYERIIFAGEDGAGTLGMTIDQDERQLWVCKILDNDTLDGAIWIFDLDTEERVHNIDLAQAAEHANCNDLVIATPGVALVADRELPHIYRVDGERETVEIWAKHHLLESHLVGTNGIAITPDRSAVIATNYLPARLMVMPMDDPDDVQKIDLRGDAFFDGLGGADGIVFYGNALYVSFPNKVARVVPEGRSWLDARVQTAKLPEGGYSAVTLAGTDLYLIRGQVVKYVLGSDPDLPFKIRRFDWSTFD